MSKYFIYKGNYYHQEVHSSLEQEKF